MVFNYVIEHQNVTGLRSYKLRDYIKELNDKNRREGLTAEEMEWLEEAVNEREARKKCKSYTPNKDEERDFRRKQENREEGIFVEIRKYASFTDDYGNDNYEDWDFKRNEIEEIREKILEIDNESEITDIDEILKWCQDAGENEIYYLRNGEIEIVFIS